jgi:hypothetical protein
MELVSYSYILFRTCRPNSDEDSGSHGGKYEDDCHGLYLLSLHCISLILLFPILIVFPRLLPWFCLLPPPPPILLSRLWSAPIPICYFVLIRSSPSSPLIRPRSYLVRPVPIFQTNSSRAAFSSP